jgi:peptide/nickel transport system substrate-binding protein
MSSRSIRNSFIAALGAAALALSGCAAGGSSDPKDTSVAIAVLSSPEGGWDPAMWNWTIYTQIQQAAYDSLFRVGVDGKINAGLAEKWERVSPNELRVELRKDVVFADGSEFNAEVVKQNMDHKANSGGRTAPLIAGVEVEVVDEYNIVLRTEAPRPDLEQVLSKNQGMMVSPVALADPELLRVEPYGAGPYLLDTSRTIADDTYTFTKNADYWDAESVHFDEMVFRVIQQPEARFNAVRSGQVDMAPGDYTNLAQAQSSPNINVTEDAGSIYAFTLVGAGTEQAPALGDVRVRQAMNYAINREDFAEFLVPGNVTSQIFGLRNEAHNPEVNDYYDYDPEKARELLTEAGYPDGFTLSVLSLVSMETPLEAVAGDLEAVGITVERVVKPIPEYVKSAVAKEYPVIFSPLTDEGAYTGIRDMFLPTGPKTPQMLVNPEIDRLYAEALMVADDAERRELFREIAAITVKDAWMVPIVQSSFYYYSADTVGGIEWPMGDQYPSIRNLVAETE